MSFELVTASCRDMHWVMGDRHVGIGNCADSFLKIISGDDLSHDYSQGYLQNQNKNLESAIYEELMRNICLCSLIV